MQINKLHVQPHAVNAPNDRKLTSPRGSDPDPGSARSRRSHLLSGNPAATALADELQSIPEIRADRVEVARMRLASGEYTSRDVAVQSAASILKSF